MNGNILAENLQAFSIILTVAGIKWTLASDLLGYDSVNYGLFYDDVQYFAPGPEFKLSNEAAAMRTATKQKHAARSKGASTIKQRYRAIGSLSSGAGQPSVRP